MDYDPSKLGVLGGSPRSFQRLSDADGPDVEAEHQGFKAVFTRFSYRKWRC